MPPSLPYDVLLHIFSYLDPIQDPDEGLRTTPASLLQVQRHLGSTLSLLSRDWRDVGVRYLWSNFVLSFATSQSRRKLVLLVGNDEVATRVKRLLIIAGAHDVEQTVGMPIEFLLPSLPNLESLEISAPPYFAQRLFSQLEPDNLERLRHLTLTTLNTSLVEHPYYPAFLLNLLPRFPKLTSLEIGVDLPASGTLSHVPLVRLQHLTRFLLSNSTTGPSTLAIPFLSSLLSLIEASKDSLTSLSLGSRTIPSTLPEFISTLSRLEHLSITCDRTSLELEFARLVEHWSKLTNLRTVSIGVLPDWTAPLHLASSELSDRLVVQLFNSFENSLDLTRVSLDVDLTRYESTVQAWLKDRWHRGNFEVFEWCTWIPVQRERVQVRFCRRASGGWQREQDGVLEDTIGA
ncbi:uncharacterized protein JCM15063_002836 [Sporobolomyces koalae]|uniref:uncharacterized protein n=1 Tax=Sporobolomyces koalae TaxID=500713 RepID=UPI00317C5189